MCYLRADNSSLTVAAAAFCRVFVPRHSHLLYALIHNFRRSRLAARWALYSLRLYGSQGPRCCTAAGRCRPCNLFRRPVLYTCSSAAADVWVYLLALTHEVYESSCVWWSLDVMVNGFTVNKCTVSAACIQTNRVRFSQVIYVLHNDVALQQLNGYHGNWWLKATVLAAEITQKHISSMMSDDCNSNNAVIHVIKCNIKYHNRPEWTETTSKFI